MIQKCARSDKKATRNDSIHLRARSFWETQIEIRRARARRRLVQDFFLSLVLATHEKTNFRNLIFLWWRMPVVQKNFPTSARDVRARSLRARADHSIAVDPVLFPEICSQIYCGSPYVIKNPMMQDQSIALVGRLAMLHIIFYWTHLDWWANRVRGVRGISEYITCF